MSVPVDAFVELLLSQDGDRYIFGHEVSPSDSDPDAFDCSELVQWAEAGVKGETLEFGIEGVKLAVRLLNLSELLGSTARAVRVTECPFKDL